MKLIFVLGANPALSLVELRSVLKTDVTLICTGAAMAEVDDSLFESKNKCGEYFAIRLGGVIKVAELMGESAQNKLQEKLNKVLFELSSLKPTKFVFGLSFYGMRENKKGSIVDVKRLGIEAKKTIKETGKSVRYVEGEHGELSAVQVDKNNIIAKGAEVIIIEDMRIALDQKNFLIAKTLAVQPYEQYSERDYGRPARDSRSGMLPPKLARIMVNMALPAGNVNPETKLLDPFCGSGTILTEAALMGIKNIYGSDVSPTATESTKKNLLWTINSASIKLISEIKTADAKITEKTWGAVAPIDAVAAEPFLGVPLRGTEEVRFLENSADELSKLYLSALKSLFNILKKGGRVVFIAPAFKIQQKPEYKELFVKSETKVTKYQNKWVTTLKKTDIENLGFKLIYNISEGESILLQEGAPEMRVPAYFRENQFLARVIFTMEKPL